MPVIYNELSEHIQVELLPKYTTSLFQPIDQLIAGTDVNNFQSTRAFCKKIKKDGIYNIDESWNEIKTINLSNVWHKIWLGFQTSDPAIVERIEEENIVTLSRRIHFSAFDNKAFVRWFKLF